MARPWVLLGLVPLLMSTGCLAPSIDRSPGSRVLSPGLLGKGIPMPSQIQIGLAVAQHRVAFSTHGSAHVGEVTLEPDKPYAVFPGKMGLTLAQGNVVLIEGPSPLVVKTGELGALGINRRRYRGDFAFISAPEIHDRITLINRVPVEAYLYGVVPAEMPSGWPLEALKCQAVAARTFALANLGRRAHLGFDLFDTTADQVYRGYSAEKPDSTLAVDATRLQVLLWQDRLISSYFHSSSGGETDDALAVWGQDLPYIRGIPDLDHSPNASWEAFASNSQIEKILVDLGHGAIGRLDHLEVVTWTPHGRAQKLVAKGSGGEAHFEANVLRPGLGLKSTRFKLMTKTAGWTFVGGGWGHGLGMSQWGARAYAQNNEGYAPILNRYYAETRLVTLNDL